MVNVAFKLMDMSGVGRCFTGPLGSTLVGTSTDQYGT